MVLSGSVENIIYRNEENGYSVIEIDADGIPVVCVGNFPIISEGQIIEAEGEYKKGKYGEQFVCSIIKYHSPKTAEAITRYLASGLIKGIGPVTASAIVDKFGENTLEIIEKAPSALTEIKGISGKKAAEIGAAVLALKDMQAAVMYLQKYNITINLALKIYKKYHSGTQEILSENPYRLIEDVEGIGFITADKIASNMGIEKDSEFRIRAGLVYALKNTAEAVGSTYMPKGELISILSELLDLDFTQKKLADVFENVLVNLMIDGVVKKIEDGNENIMLSVYYNLEKYISVKLARLLNFLPPQFDDIDFLISSYEKINEITLHADQKAAVKIAVENGVSVITGGPGTGKTTIIKCILYVLKNQGKTALCAPTGRAAKRLSESTQQEAKTIHRLLELNFNNSERYFAFDENNPLDADTVIVDEVSMVDEFLFNSLLRALKEGTRLILVGDKDQLPSIGAGNVLANIIESGAVKVQMLTKIYRQGKQSLIVLNAHAINNGNMPDLYDNNSDFFFIEKRTPKNIHDTVTQLCIDRLPQYLNCAAQDIQVLSPMKKGLSGVENLNKSLQEIINPHSKDKRELRFEDRVFREGDKVMQTVNNYNLKWIKNSVFAESGEGVFNGDIGFITGINGLYDLTVEFEDGRVADYSATDIGDLVLAYAISVHKSQGCEFDAVVLPVTGGPPTLLTRNLLYTAITRAKKLVVLVGARFMVEKMVNNNYTRKRYSFLADFIKQQCSVLEGLQ
jgi:exodeoxyribonuclease V alpha subunit